jgi:hypothetical protein
VARFKPGDIITKLDKPEIILEVIQADNLHSAGRTYVLKCLSNYVSTRGDKRSKGDRWRGLINVIDTEYNPKVRKDPRPEWF